MYIPVPLQMLLNEFYKIVRAIRPRTCTRQPGAFRAGGYDLLLLPAAYLEADTVNGSTLETEIKALRRDVLELGL